MHAQNAYSFEQITAPYVELTGGTVCDHSQSEFHFVHDLDGETVWFYGLPFPLGGPKTMIIGSKGFLRVDNDSSAIYADALTTDLVPIDGSSDVRYEITGAAGDRVLKAQWRNWRLLNGPPTNFANCQIWYHQSTGVIELRYGPNSGSDLDYDGTNGPYCGIFYSPDDFLSIYEKLWLTGDALAPTLDSLPVINWSTLHNLPAPNTVYRFTPRFAVTGVEEPVSTIATPRVELFPNPASDQLTIASTDRPERILLMDIGGRTVRSTAGQEDRTVLDVSDLPPGTYSARVILPQRAVVWRWVKR